MLERQPRVPFTRPVFVTALSGIQDRAHRLVAANISEGGMFVRSETRFAPGTPVSVSLEARGHVFPFAEAEVVWEAPDHDPAPRNALPGFGLKFTQFLHPRSTELLSHLLERRPGGKLELAPPRGVPEIPEEEHVVEVDVDLEQERHATMAAPDFELDHGRTNAAAVGVDLDLGRTSEAPVGVDLDLGRDRMPAPLTAQARQDGGKRVAAGTAFVLFVVLVSAVLLLRGKSSEAEASEDLEAVAAPELLDSDELNAAPVAGDLATVDPSPVALAAASAPEVPVEPRVAPKPVASPPKPVASAPKPAPAPVTRKASPTTPVRSAAVDLPHGAVSAVRASGQAQELEVTLTLAPGARIDRAFALTGPSRLVFDVDGAKPRASFQTSSKLPQVSSVRIGALGDGTRVVLDVERPIAKVVTTRTGARVTFR